MSNPQEGAPQYPIVEQQPAVGEHDLPGGPMTGHSGQSVADFLERQEVAKRAWREQQYAAEPTPKAEAPQVSAPQRWVRPRIGDMFTVETTDPTNLEFAKRMDALSVEALPRALDEAYDNGFADEASWYLEQLEAYKAAQQRAAAAAARTIPTAPQSSPAPVAANKRPVGDAKEAPAVTAAIPAVAPKASATAKPQSEPRPKQRPDEHTSYSDDFESFLDDLPVFEGRRTYNLAPDGSEGVFDQDQPSVQDPSYAPGSIAAKRAKHERIRSLPNAERLKEIDALPWSEKIEYLPQGMGILTRRFVSRLGRIADKHLRSYGARNQRHEMGEANAGPVDVLLKPGDPVTLKVVQELQRLSGEDEEGTSSIIDQYDDEQKKAIDRIIDQLGKERSRRTRRIMIAVGTVAVATAFTATYLITKDSSHAAAMAQAVHPTGSGMGHLTTLTPSPSGGTSHALASASPSGSHSASTLASASPTPSGSSHVGLDHFLHDDYMQTHNGGSGNTFNDALQAGKGIGNHGHAILQQPVQPVQPPVEHLGGHAGAPSVDHAIQIGKEFAHNHHGQTQPVWSSLKAAGFSDDQINNAIQGAVKKKTLIQVPAQGGGYFLRVASNGSDNATQVMNVLKGFMS